MTDELTDLHNNINTLKKQIMSYIDQKHTYRTSKMDKYHTDTVLQRAQNFYNNNKDLLSQIGYYQFNNMIGELQADYSKWQTDQTDPKKVVLHSANKVMNIIQDMAKNDSTPTADEISNLNRFRRRHGDDATNKYDSDSDDTYNDIGNKSTNPYWEDDPRFKRYVKGLWDRNKYNYNIWKKYDHAYEAPADSWTMISHSLTWMGYRDKVNDFINRYGKPKKGYIAFQYGTGDTFYFPADMAKGGTAVDLTKKIYQNYYGNLDKEKLAGKQTFNLYGKMWHSLYPNNYSNAKKSISNNTLADVNNHPSDSTTAEKGMAKAETNYQYKIQKDRNWEQYHEDQLRRMHDYSKQLQNEINKAEGAKKRHPFTYGKHKFLTYAQFYNYMHKYHPTKLKRLKKLQRELATRQEGNTPYSRKQLIAKIGNLEGQTKHHAFTYKGKSYKTFAELSNVLSKTKSGRKVLNKINTLNNELIHYVPGGEFYGYEVARRNWWKKQADTLQAQWKTEVQKDTDEAYYQATVDNLKADPRFGNYAYIRPVNPNTEDSYVFMEVTEESPTHETEAATEPIEWGRNITASTQKQATEIEITGYLFNHNMERGGGYGDNSDPTELNHHNFDLMEPVKQDSENIADWADAGAECYYSGLNMYPHCIITEWNPDFNVGGDGTLSACSFSMTIQTADYFQSNVQPKQNSKSRQGGGKRTKKGKKSTKRGTKGTVTVKSGETMWKIANKHHIPLKLFENANRHRVRNFNLIYPGNKLIIPNVSKKK